MWRDELVDDGRIAAPRRWRTALAAAIAVASVVAAAHTWLAQIFAIPHDPQRADMLIVVQQGIRRVLSGRNPYTIYHVPWDAPLPYGPMLWAPYVAPFALHADVRLMTIAGELFVPVAIAAAAVITAHRGRVVHLVACFVLLEAIAFNPDLVRFASIGHTPSYWPLLALFAWLVAAERWTAAAICMGLLVVARTTMVAMVPVWLMAVWWRQRPRFLVLSAITAAAAAVPFLPFAIADVAALRYALYGSYQNVMKTFVWPSTTWVPHTIGVTGILLASHLSRWVEPVQAVVMLVTYAGCWLAIRNHRPALPWMALALLMFSMTTLWPVTYIYFDVFLLLAAFALAGLMARRQPTAFAPWRLWTVTAAATATVVVVSAFAMLPAEPAVNASARGDRTWQVLLPRRTRAAAIVDVEYQPLRSGTSQRELSAMLNGTPIGNALVPDASTRAAFKANANVWWFGVNQLELSASEAGSVAVGRVAVRPAQ